MTISPGRRGTRRIAWHPAPALGAKVAIIQQPNFKMNDKATHKFPVCKGFDQSYVVLEAPLFVPLITAQFDD